MAYQVEEIVSQFKDAGVPKTGLSPTVNIITIDGVSVVSGGAMTEISGGRYKYDFTNYNKNVQYLITTDGGPSLSDSDRYQEVTNILDAYPNKADRKGGGGGIVQNIDTKQLAKDVRLQKTTGFENKEGTFGQKLVSLDIESVLKAIKKVEIPKYDEILSSLDQKADKIIETGNITRSKAKKSVDMIGDTMTKLGEIDIKLSSEITSAKDEIKLSIGEVKSSIESLPIFDYERIENAIAEKAQSNMPVLKQIEDLKEELKKEIGRGNKSDLKEFLLKSIENQQETERRIEEQQLQNEMRLSLKTIENGLGELKAREIDFEPIYNEIKEVANSVNEGTKSIENLVLDKDVRKEMQENYVKSMKYIVYIAKNIGHIGKSDFQEIRKSLSNLKR